jgi:hypothetical protein
MRRVPISAFCWFLAGAGLGQAADIEADRLREQDSMVVKARLGVSEFVQSLPNFVCQETISRFRSAAPLRSSQPLDVLTAELVFENGHERYRNLRRNGKPLKRRREHLTGAWSTGEFGSALVEVLSVSTGAQFRLKQEISELEQGKVAVYDFVVDREHSQWMLFAGDRGVSPPYQGSLQIDISTGHVWRMEMETSNLPLDFPLERVESTVDYHGVEIGGQVYLLPVQSELLMCFRSANSCVKNVITFSHCRKYGSESSLRFAELSGASDF